MWCVGGRGAAVGRSAGGGSEYAYEVLNLVDGERSVADVREAVSVIYGPISMALVSGYLESLAQIDILSCDWNRRSGSSRRPWNNLCIAQSAGSP